MIKRQDGFAVLKVLLEWGISVRAFLQETVMVKMSEGMKSPYDNVIFAVDGFFTNGIQIPQHQWNKCMGCKRDYIEK